MVEYFASLTGANCTVGGQAIISLNATEDFQADYATASAVLLAPDGWFEAGAEVETIEGGESTGHWVVDDSGSLYSGSRTWRKRAGDEGYDHIPLITCRLRRKGYLQARSTLSKALVGADNYPPKFCTYEHRTLLQEEVAASYHNGEIDFWTYYKGIGNWLAVADGAGVIRQLCAWAGLPVHFLTGCPACADEYLPVGKTIMAAVKEVAGWSGASAYLDRDGVLVIYDFLSRFGSGAAPPQPRSVLELEQHQALFAPTMVTVIGKGYQGRVVNEPAEPGHWGASGRVWHPATPARTYISGHFEKAVEVTETLSVPGGGPVEERIEISAYHISPALAQSIARERLMQVASPGQNVVFRGPAEGYQAYQPVYSPIFTVNRTLNWNGTAYRYEVEVAGPRTGYSWDDTESGAGWW